MDTQFGLKPPTKFWVISATALLWNLIGVAQYLTQAFMSDTTKALLPSDQLKLLTQTPAWLNGIFAVAVFGGLIGCVGLLLKKRWAKAFFGFSLAAVLIQMGYSIFNTKAIEVYGIASLFMSIFIIIVAILLFLFAKQAASKKWIS